MKISNLLIAILLSSSITVGYAQSVKNKSAKFTELIMPGMPVQGIKDVKILIHTGQGLGLSQDDLFEKKGLGKKLQAMQDNINGLGPQYVTFQEYLLVSGDPDALVEIAFGSFKEHDKELKEHKVVCIRDDGKIDKEDILECPAYYYDVQFTLPLVIKISKQGKLLRTHLIDQQGTVRFGYKEEAGYLKTSELEAAYSKSGAATIARNAVKARLEESATFVQESFYFQTEKAKVDIASGGGKFDYSNLDELQVLAINFLENQSYAPSSNLGKIISGWDKELETLDPDDSKARINRKLAGYLALNKAKLYYHAGQYDKAAESSKEALDYFRFVNNTAHKDAVHALNSKIARLDLDPEAVASNRELISGKPMEAAPIMDWVKVKEKNAPYQILQTTDHFQAYKEEHYAFTGTSESSGNQTASLGELLSESLAAASNTPWEDRVQFAPNMGWYINMSYTNNETIPIEICELESLNTLLANNAKINAVPGEIGNLRNLKNLNLAANQLTSIPDEVGQLTELRKLNLSKNQLTSLPSSLASCKNLKSLSLKGNKIPQEDIDKIQTALPGCKIKI